MFLMEHLIWIKEGCLWKILIFLHAKHTDCMTVTYTSYLGQIQDSRFINKLPEPY